LFFDQRMIPGIPSDPKYRLTGQTFSRRYTSRPPADRVRTKMSTSLRKTSPPVTCEDVLDEEYGGVWRSNTVVNEETEGNEVDFC
jgi:hypothetical protein